MKRVVCAIVLLFVAINIQAANTLRVVSAGPIGEVSTLAETSEVRIVFNEPMVVVGKIPQPVTAPFFKIAPNVAGTFRWSGTTTLIFTPKAPLPYATEYTVTIDAATAKSVAGNTLDKPYKFTFVTPTIRLMGTDWYRRDGKMGNPIVISLRFNQPVDAATILQHLQLRTVAHPIEAPVIADPSKVDAASQQAFDAKLAKAQAAAASNGSPVFVSVATTWDKERFPPGNDQVVLETKPGVGPDTNLQIILDDKLAARRSRNSGREQTFILELEPTFFVNQMWCYAQCDPEGYNPIVFRTRGGVPPARVRKALTVTDVTDPAKPVVVKPGAMPERDSDFPSPSYSLDELGWSLQPAHTYVIKIDPSLEAADGQKLGYTWAATVENWHKTAFVSFGDGHGVWESTGGPLLPFHGRNYRSVTQWLAPLSIEQLMPTMVQLRASAFREEPPKTKGIVRKLTPRADRIQSYGLDLKSAIGDDNMGLVWAAVKPGDPIAKSKEYSQDVRASLIQATNLGLSVKDSPQNTLVLVTRLDDGEPVAGAKVSIRNTSNKVVWTGTTGADGIAIAPNTDLRRKKNKTPEEEEEWYDWQALGELHFAVIAEKDGDVVYVGSDWNENISPWDFGVDFNVNEADPLLRGTVFTDRGVYKLGEEIHLKAILRSDTPNGMQLLPQGSNVDVVIRDSHDNEIDKRTLTTNAWSSAEWTARVPNGAPLGNYSVYAKAAGQKLQLYGSFLVAAYRRPDFRVDATLTGNSTLAGEKLNGTINGRYLFGAPMSGRDVQWTYSKRPAWDVPAKITDRWPAERWDFLGWNWREDQPERVIIEQKTTQLAADGTLKLPLATDKTAGWPYDYELEGVVTDITRQQIAGRTSYRIDPAPWYIGLRRPPYFADSAKGIDTEVIAAGLDGLAVAGVKVKVTLKQIQWASVRQGEGGGFYEWHSEPKEIDAGEWNITTQANPVPLHVDFKDGGQYVLVATATDAEGRKTTTRSDFYALGPGYTAWNRYDHNRIDLVPEKQTYRPGETARIMIKSPWETATALLTTEREGVRTWTPFELTSTQQTITVPISEKDIPNVFVSVLLVKGRTKKEPDADGSDPGKPAFRLGYVELTVEDASKRLTVDVKANREEYRPATKAQIEVNVKDVNGKPSQSEVVLWAVDYGVLSLTGYETPDVLESIYLRKSLQVVNEDSRQRIISRRVLTPKGASEGGGGGADAGPGTLRKDFRVLAFWLGSLTTDANGRARTEVTLPESLTTYRIMAVAGDKLSRFGWAQNEIRINKPLMLTAAWPRFMTAGDRAHFGGVVHNQSQSRGRATITIKSLDPSVLEFATEKQTVDLAPGGSAEVRFDATAKTIGEARVQMRVQMGRENDGFEDIIPVRVIATPETFAAYGEAKPRAEEKFEIPTNIIPGFGGLRVDFSSTMLVGLGEGARYLVEYPYGCAEQRSSKSLALMLAADLGEAFSLPGIDAKGARPAAQQSLDELKNFQCGDGGFSFWAGDCWSTSPYLTSYVVHVYQRAEKLGYTVDGNVMTRAYDYLGNKLNEPPPTNAAWMPSYTAWQAFVMKVLLEGGRNVDTHLERVYGYRDRMPVFALAFLADAFIAKNERGERLEDVRRRILNSIKPEGGTAFVNELSDPYLLYFWNSNIRSTAIVLGTLVRDGQNEEIVKRMVRWLMQVRKGGRWGNTQENAWAMGSLVDYYKKYESEVPDFTGSMAMNSQTIATEAFKGRTTDSRTQNFSMQQLMTATNAQAGTQVPVVFTREGTGTLYYMMRLRYARSLASLAAMDQGFRIERSYNVQGGEGTPRTSFKAGDLIEITLLIRATKERRFVAVTDPIPAGTEPVEAWFATTASALAEAQMDSESGGDWTSWFRRGGFDHVERHDDRVNLFATRLGEGDHFFTYLVRATTAGTFLTAPTHVEQMYEPEVFGRTATTTVEIKK
ncbi:MAG TPA: MG2 domain-containing protein [Thermoanaerobaculia bacterium]